MSAYRYTAVVQNGKVIESNDFKSIVYRCSEYLNGFPLNFVVKIYDNVLSKKTDSTYVVGTYTYCESNKLNPFYED